MEQLLLKSVLPTYEFPIKSKIYTAFVKNKDFLDFVKIPEIQREIDTEWVNNLKEQILKEKTKRGYYDFGLFDIACLNNTLYILNGQHRYAILNELDGDIIIELRIYHVKSEQEMNELFMKVNGSRPSVIMKSSTSQMKMNHVRKYLIAKYNSYITKSKNPRRPNINIDSLIEKLEEEDLFTNMSHDDIINKIEQLNEMYIYSKPDNLKDYDTIMLKCRQKNPVDIFVLGMFKNNSWVKQLKDTNMSIINIRQKINKKLRNLVWKKRNGNSLIGSCYVCNTNVDYDAFECAHIVSVFEGGDNSLNNLEPTCRQCNNDMGTINLNDYKSEFITYNTNIIV
jgi:hypothetical protein